MLTDHGRARLTWTASTSSVKEYHVYRAQAEEPWKTKFEKVAAVKGTSWLDKNLAAGKVYYYTVRAIGHDGEESRASFRGRTQPRVALTPVASVLAADRIEVTWNAHPASDVAGYNIYRGAVLMRAVKKGEPKPWRDNDPEYFEPMPVEVRNITDIHKLNDEPVKATRFLDTKVSLIKNSPAADEYKHQVFAYIIRAVNRLGTESGPSPYALTIPSAPTHFLNREKGEFAELKWAPNPEKGIAGYRIYKLEGTWNIVPLTKEPITATTFTHKGGKSQTRYWVVAVDALGQEGEPSSPVWHNRSYTGFFQGEWHQ